MVCAGSLVGAPVHHGLPPSSPSASTSLLPSTSSSSTLARSQPVRPRLPPQGTRQVGSSSPPSAFRFPLSQTPTRLRWHSETMALAPASSGKESVIPEVEMNGGADQLAATTVRATVVQASSVFYDTPATLDKAEKFIAEAAGNGSQLVVFPEAFIGGYPHGCTFGLAIGNRTAKGKEDFRKYHAAAIEVPGPEVSRLASLAGKYKVFLVMGVIERAGYTLYNTVLFFDPLGKYLGKHRKLVPTALERVFWGFGDGSTLPVFDTQLGKIGALLCWENKMPLARTAMYAKGIQIYCAPTADASPTWVASMTHIALEGGCFVVSANQFCRRSDYPPPPEYTFGGLEEEPSPETVVCPGGSVIVSPSGTVLAGPNFEGEGLVTADLDLGEIVRAKFDFDVVGHYSRPEVLSLVVKTDPKPAVSFTASAADGERASAGKGKGKGDDSVSLQT